MQFFVSKVRKAALNLRSVVKTWAYLKALWSWCFCSGCRKNLFTGKGWGLSKERFGTFFNEANRSKIDKHQRKKIDNDFTQSYWLALQFVPTNKNKPNWIFTVVCHRHPTELMYGKLEKLTGCLLAKLHPLNLVNTIFYLVS